jgi:ADP-ribosylglycohydrolase
LLKIPSGAQLEERIMKKGEDRKDRYLGCLMGLAVGDALGTTLEFKAPGSFEPLTDMVGGGPFHLEPGQWTDDTSMALCLAESLHKKPHHLGSVFYGYRDFSKTQLSDHYSPVPGYWEGPPTEEEIDEIAAGSFKYKNPPEIIGSGYVVKSLEAALWAFHRSHSFREGALLAVNLGNDADTAGAVYGQIAGAFYGYEGIPEEWRARIARKELIESLAGRLYQLPRSMLY